MNTPDVCPRDHGTTVFSLDKGEEEERGGNKASADEVLKLSLR